ncbi:MAG: type II toxin-antitoxin system RelE/ParE family toxin [Proteobacteria bacterium]|nr:type II toxin-antitoxin system RelE/ParE family toxin [Pseudomonadota bacterium]
MRFQVVMTDGAGRDLASIHEYIAANDSPAKADLILDALLSVVDSLESMPERGSRPRELLAIGRKEYRRVIHGPWHIFYRVIGRTVYIGVIADGRRDLRTLLEQRLLGA